MITRENLELIFHTLDDKKAIDIKIIDISNISIMTDYFVVASASNINHVHALAEHVEDELKKVNLHFSHMEGFKNGNWILMDYGDVVIHIFDDASREFYDLEHIWKDGTEINIA